MVPDEMLTADIKQGIAQNDVESRRKRYGWNEITTEKENLFLKFLGFFTGPVLYGMSPYSSPIASAASRTRFAPSMPVAIPPVLVFYAPSSAPLAPAELCFRSATGHRSAWGATGA